MSHDLRVSSLAAITRVIYLWLVLRAIEGVVSRKLEFFSPLFLSLKKFLSVLVPESMKNPGCLDWWPERTAPVAGTVDTAYMELCSRKDLGDFYCYRSWLAIVFV